MNQDEHNEQLEQWLRNHKRILFKVVNATTSDPVDQNDLFQDIVIQLWKSIPKFRGEAKESTWVFRVAVNSAALWRRKESTQSDKVEHHENVDTVLRASDTHTNHQVAKLYEEIRALDSIDRSIILLALESYTYSEIAETLGMTQNHVGVKINRIKKHLSARLKGDQQ